MLIFFKFFSRSLLIFEPLHGVLRSRENGGCISAPCPQQSSISNLPFETGILPDPCYPFGSLTIEWSCKLPLSTDHKWKVMLTWVWVCKDTFSKRNKNKSNDKVQGHPISHPTCRKTDWLHEPQDPRCNTQLQTSFLKPKGSFMSCIRKSLHWYTMQFLEVL